MSRFEKIKRMITIALGFAFATYLIMSGIAMLKQDEKKSSSNEFNKTASLHNEVIHVDVKELNSQQQ